MYIHRYSLSILIVIFSACSSFSQTAPAISPSETIIEPTATKLSFTPTYEVTKTPIPISTTTLQHPTPTLAPDWDGIPVIPGAFKGWQGGSVWYVYQIYMPVDEVEKFYMKEFESSGLTLRYYDKGGTTTYGGINAVHIEFKREDTNEIFQVSMGIFPEDNSTIITLSKYRLDNR